MQAKTSSDIIPETRIRKMKRASTFPATVEARSGHNGKLSNMESQFSVASCQFPVFTFLLPHLFAVPFHSRHLATGCARGGRERSRPNMISTNAPMIKFVADG